MKNGSEALTKWKRVSVPIYLNVYVFNIKNPLDLERGYDNVTLEEIGPFVFYETREKNIDSFPNDTTIFYNDIKTFYFDSNRSKYSLDHEVTAINVPLVVSLRFVVYFSYLSSWRDECNDVLYPLTPDQRVVVLDVFVGNPLILLPLICFRALRTNWPREKRTLLTSVILRRA